MVFDTSAARSLDEVELVEEVSPCRRCLDHRQEPAEIDSAFPAKDACYQRIRGLYAARGVRSEVFCQGRQARCGP